MCSSKKILAVLSCALCLFSGCGGGDNGASSEKGSGVIVKVMRMEQTLNAQVRTYVGEASASRSVVLTSPYPGTLETVAVHVGDKVAPGQLVAKLSSETVNSSYEMAMATLRQAEDGYERVMQVSQGGGVAQVKVVEVETGLAKARAAAESAKHALESCDIKAPFTGTVSEVYQHQGTEVSLATPLIRIVDESSVEIVFPVPESELATVVVGAGAQVSIPALGLTDADAAVVSKGIEADRLSHTYDCKLALSRPVDGLMPGMVCKVRLDGDAQDGYIVPANLVQTDQTGRYVWVVDDGVVGKKYVTIGAYSGKGVVVSEGLGDGDMVISEGFQKVSTGMKVNVIE